MSGVVTLRFPAAWSLVLLLLPGMAVQARSGFVERVYRDADGDHRYTVYVPDEEPPAEGWPVMLYLHGAGGRGRDGEHLSDGPAPLLLHDIIDWPMVVVYPQCENTEGPIFECWRAGGPDAQRALEILADVEEEFAVDERRRVLAGWSMGGYGAWSIAAAMPEHWSAVVPVAGGGDPETAPQLVDVPLWAIHGEIDQAVLPERSREMTEAVRQAGGSPTLTLLPDVGHDSWKHAFAGEAVRDWMLSPGRVTADSSALRDEVRILRDSDAFARLSAPFQAQLVIPRAVSLRVGRRALDAIEEGIPSLVPAEALADRLDDIQMTVGGGDATYQVTLSELSYHAHLGGVHLETSDRGIARLELGLAPLDIRIGRIEIESEAQRAVATDVLIRIGHLRPVAAEFTVEPVLVDHQLRLQLQYVRFHIADDNWYVDDPSEISVTGDDLTAELVETGIVGSVYQHREMFETRIRRSLPRVLDDIEEVLAPGDLEELAAVIWPLPVYQPRLRLRMDDLAVDAGGFSLMLGLEADPGAGLRSRRTPRVLGPVAGEVPRSEWLQVGVTPDVLQPLAQMLLDAGVSRIDVGDLPQPELAALRDRAHLAEYLPALQALPPDTQTRVQLVLREPFELRALEPAEPDGSDSVPALFRAAGLAVEVAVRPAVTASTWTPFAEFDVELTQRLVGRLTSGDDGGVILEVVWDGPPQVAANGRYLDPAYAATGAGAGGAGFDSASLPSPDAERFARFFSDGWQAWTAAGKTTIEQPVLAIGETVLRIERLSAEPAVRDADTDSIWWRATLQSPPTVLRNTGDAAVNYQIRDPGGVWNPSRTLPPGEEHRYRTGDLHVRLLQPRRTAAFGIQPGESADLAQQW